MKYCELCKGLARTYCESDQASLCWNCDVKVHGANFLVARHSRTVLCHACQSPTPWKASGAELGVTVSVCESCVVGGRNRGQDDGEESQGGNDDEIHTDDDDDDEEEDEADRGGEHHDDEEDNDEEVGDDDDEDGDNQVVPWSATSSATPPPVASSSSSEESVSRFGNDAGEASQAFSLKRFREISSDLTSQDRLDRTSPKRKYLSQAVWSGADGGDASAESRPLKAFRAETKFPGQTQPGLRTESVVESVRGFRRRDTRNLSG